MAVSEERIKALCSVTAVAYLTPTINTTRTGDPLEYFENRLRNLRGEKNLDDLMTEGIRSALNLNTNKRGVDNNLRESPIWQEEVVDKLYSRLKSRDSAVDLYDFVPSLSVTLKSTITIVVETNTGFETYQSPFDKNYSNKINLFAKCIPQGSLESKYEFSFQPSSDLVSEPDLVGLITCFVSHGVEYLTDKLGWYEAVSTGQREKAGKWADAIGEVTGACIGGLVCSMNGLDPKIGAKVGSTITEKLLKQVGESEYRKKAMEIMKAFPGFGSNNYENTCRYQNIFISTFLNIFQVFEYQLVRISADCTISWSLYIKMLCFEIVDRMMNWISKNDNRDLDKLEGILIEGAVKGELKSNFSTVLIPKYLHLFNSLKPGFEIKELNWQSKELVEKCGVFHSGRYFYDARVYSVDAKRRIAQYGCRQLTHFEKFSTSGAEADMTEIVLRTRFHQVLLAGDEFNNLKLFEYRLGSPHLILDPIFHKIKNQIIENNATSRQIETMRSVEQIRSMFSSFATYIPELMSASSSSLINSLTRAAFELPPLAALRLFGRKLDLQNVYDSFIPRGGSTNEKYLGPNISNQITVITGLGGIGKTDLALEYAKIYRSDYDGNIIWINAETDDTIKASFLRFQQFLGINSARSGESSRRGNDPEPKLSEIFRLLAVQNYLLIFDNVENEIKEDYKGRRFLYDYFPFTMDPGKRQNILITSRIVNWDKLNVIQLNELCDEDGQEFILQSLTGPVNLGDDRFDVQGDALKLTNRLQGLPLALGQAVAFINETNRVFEITGSNYTVGNYLHELEETDGKVEAFFQFELPNGTWQNKSQKTVFATWLVTIGRIRRMAVGPNDMALRILYCLSYMHADTVPTAWFLDILDTSGNSQLDRKRLIGSSIDVLRNYSLVTFNKGGTISIHRILQDVIRFSCDDATVKTTLKDCFSILQSQLALAQLLPKEKMPTAKLEIISHVESVWCSIFLGQGKKRDVRIIVNYVSFTLKCVQELVHLDKMHSCLRFCHFLMNHIDAINSDDMTELDIILNFSKEELYKLTNEAQLRLCSEFTFQDKFESLHHFTCSLEQEEVQQYQESILRLVSLISLPCVSDMDKMFRDILNKFHSASGEAGAVNWMSSPFLALNCRQMIVYNDMYCIMLLTLYPAMCIDVYALRVAREWTEASHFKGVFRLSVLGWAFGLHDSLTEHERSYHTKALELFLYINERFKTKFKIFQTFQILNLELIAFCYFNLREMPHAIGPLRKCAWIYQSSNTRDNIANVESYLANVERAIGYLKVENDFEVENSLKYMIGIIVNKNLRLEPEAYQKESHMQLKWSLGKMNKIIPYSINITGLTL